MFELSDTDRLHGIPDPQAHEDRDPGWPAAITETRAKQQVESAQTRSARVREANAVLDCLESNEVLTSREIRASRAADRQGLSLRKSRLRRSSVDDPFQYGLVYARHNQPIADDLELDAVEDWLGIQPTTKD